MDETRTGACTYSGLLEEIFASFLARSVSGSMQVLHVDENRARKHDCLEQNQADFPFASILSIDDCEKVVEI